MKNLRERGFLLIFPGMIILMLIGCVRVKVETAGDKKSLSEKINQTGNPTGPQQYCQVPPFSQQLKVPHALPVTKHPNVNLTPEETDRIFAEATKVAQDGQGRDIRCKIELKREISRGEDKIDNFKIDPVALSQPNSNDCFVFGEICSEFDFEILNALEPQGVKVVEEISWCQRTGTALIGGCSKLKGKSMAVARYCTNEPCPILEGVLWLHEFGHNKNLVHRSLDDSEHGVMYPGVNSQNTSLNECECQALRN